MSDGLVLPVGADLTGLHQAFSTISASAARMGQRINSSMAGNQAAFNRLGNSTNSIGSSFQGLFGRIGTGGAAAFSGVASAGKAAFASIAAAMPMLGAAGGIGGIGAAIAVTMKSISSAANMEGLETSFAPLLGGADKAEARIAELSQFAANTPFELPEVAKASRVLEVLTKGALSTGSGLTLVGDVAATTQQPFEELALWIGRLYDGLQSRRPVGEAMARLQELGVVSGDVRSRIEAMQEAGADGDEVWSVAAGAMGKFSEAMDAQSQTWNGKLSNLKDSIGMAMAKFGEPIMDALKPYLESAAKMATSLGQRAVEFGQKIAESIKFVSAAFASGQVGALMGASIKLGFVNAVNYLWRGLNGTFAAAGQYLIEYFRTGIAMFNILTKADFWKGMGNAIIGVFLDAIAFFQKGLAAALEAVRPLAEMIGQGDKVTAAKSTLNESAGILRGEASAQYGKAGDQLAPMMDQIQERLKTSLANIKDRFATAFSNAGDVIDPTGPAAEVRKVMEAIDAQMKKTQMEVDAAMKSKAAHQGGGGETGNSVFEKTRNAVTPSVMSLTKVGGGGGGSIFSKVTGGQANVATPKGNQPKTTNNESHLKTISGHTKKIVENTDRANTGGVTPAVYA